jgi:hypothetical protein
MREIRSSLTLSSRPGRALGFLAVLLAASLAVPFVVGERRRAEAATVPSEPAAAPVRPAAQAGSPVKIIAYYFHVTIRCDTCRRIESYSREAVERGFGRELKEGTISWRPVNVQLLENRHFIQDYRLYTRSLVLVKVREGRQVEWRNLERVWDLVGNQAEFVKYVQSNVRAYLGDG